MAEAGTTPANRSNIPSAVSAGLAEAAEVGAEAEVAEAEAEAEAEAAEKIGVSTGVGRDRAAVAVAVAAGLCSTVTAVVDRAVVSSSSLFEVE